jgi:hypothetical protein
MRFEHSSGAEQVVRIAAGRHQVGEPVQKPQGFRRFRRRRQGWKWLSHEIQSEKQKNNGLFHRGEVRLK